MGFFLRGTFHQDMVDLLTEQPDNLEFEKLLERGYNVFLFCMLLCEERIPKSLMSLRIYVPHVMFTFLREDIHTGQHYWPAYSCTLLKKELSWPPAAPGFLDLRCLELY